MPINIIVCHDLNRGIGRKNKLLASLPNDLKRFKKLTNKTICVQGKNTFESILSYNKKPLQNRINIVLTKDYNYQPNDPEVCIYHSIEEILYEYHEYGECKPNVYVIGGESIYKQMLPFADKVYATVIHNAFSEADSFFPKLDSSWKIVEQQFNKKDDNHDYDFTYITYERIK